MARSGSCPPQKFCVKFCVAAITSLMALWMAGCTLTGSKAAASSPAVSMSMSPTSTSVQAGHTQQFTVTVSGTSNTGVTWSATGGTISASGMFTAPSTAGSYVVKATSMADASVSVSAAVTVTAGVVVSISPGSANILTNGTQQFTATVTGSSNTAVTWSAAGGSITSGGLYTPPANTTGAFRVFATSVADTTQQASVIVNVSAAPVVAVSISPISASMLTGGTQQFSASVSGSSNTAVTWSATGGSVSTSGLYTAPGSAGTFTVKATSVADTTKSASATVTVSVPVVAVSVSPTSASIVVNATRQFTATVTGSSNTAVTWTASGGSISASGLYTAPATTGTFTVTATSVADTTKSASASVTVTSAPVVSVTVSPTSASILTSATQQFSATVTGSSNTAVTWSATGGSVSASGLYTAPNTAGSFTVKATSVADNTKSASATVTVSAPIQHTVTLSWTASTSSVSGYNVYRSTVSGGSFTQINTALNASTNFVDNTVASGTTYFYVVTSVDTSSVESNFSNQVSIAVPTP